MLRDENSEEPSLAISDDGFDFIEQVIQDAAYATLTEHGIIAKLKLARFRGYFPLGGERSTNGTQTAPPGISSGVPA